MWNVSQQINQTALTSLLGWHNSMVKSIEELAQPELKIQRRPLPPPPARVALFKTRLPNPPPTVKMTLQRKGLKGAPPPPPWFGSKTKRFSREKVKAKVVNRPNDTKPSPHHLDPSNDSPSSTHHNPTSRHPPVIKEIRLPSRVVPASGSTTAPTKTGERKKVKVKRKMIASRNVVRPLLRSTCELLDETQLKRQPSLRAIVVVEPTSINGVEETTRRGSRSPLRVVRVELVEEKRFNTEASYPDGRSITAFILIDRSVIDKNNFLIIS